MEALPPQVEWSLDRQVGLMRRCALGLEALDKVLGGERWRHDRPKTMGTVCLRSSRRCGIHARACAGRSDGTTDAEGSASAIALVVGVILGIIRQFARAKSKKKRTAGKSGKAAVSADAAEALTKARAFIEVAGGDGRGRGAAAAAAAALPTELRSLVQRALM